MWPRNILRHLEAEIDALNMKVFGDGWKYPPRIVAFPFRYEIKAPEKTRQEMAELVFLGKLPNEKPMRITCAR